MSALFVYRRDAKVIDLRAFFEFHDLEYVLKQRV